MGYILFANLVWPQHPGLQEATMKRQEQEQADGVFSFWSDQIWWYDDLPDLQNNAHTSLKPPHTHTPNIVLAFPTFTNDSG